MRVKVFLSIIIVLALVFAIFLIVSLYQYYQLTMTPQPLSTQQRTPMLQPTPTRRYPNGRYMFGTLETANGEIFSKLGLNDTYISQYEHSMGVDISNITISWQDYEIADGVYNENVLNIATNNIKIFLQAGQKVDVQLAIHYAPSWVMQLPDAYYVNQYGVTTPNIDGYNDPNYTFNEKIREKVKDFELHTLREIQVKIGLQNIWDFRIDAGYGGEANYNFSNDGQGHTNSYWAYDVNAQGIGDNLPAGVSPTPFPWWKPGQRTYNGQPFTVSQVQEWYNWYFNSRMNFYNWQVLLYRNTGYTHYLTFQTPGFGTRPDEYTKNIDNYLDGSGDPNHTMSRAAVWQNFYPAIINKTKIIAYISSIADGSGVPVNNLCQPDDVSVNFDTDPIVDTWSAVRFVSYIADKYGFIKGGENPGYGGEGTNTDYGITMLNNAGKQMASCGLIGMFWAHDEQLYATTNVPQANMITLADYAKVIAQYNEGNLTSH